MKKFAAIFLFTVLVLSLDACGNEQEPENTTPPASGSQTESTAETNSSEETEASPVSGGNILSPRYYWFLP